MPGYILLLLLIIPLGASFCRAQTNNEIFEKLVGKAVVMDSAYNVRFLRGIPDNKIAVDTDGDGRIDLIYMLDKDKKHRGARAPLLVKVVDEDGDMYLTGAGDQDSDLYVADWYGDGTIDRVVDYRDLDGDNDVDEQYLYQWIDEDYLYYSPPKYNGRSYCVAYARDFGDDNRLWYHTNYEYSQWFTEWLTDFNGDEMFVYPFYFDYQAGALTPACEIAFSFYDLDGDSLSEEAVRFEGAKMVAENLRYSMDIDNDTHDGNRHDYDFSISSLGPLTLPDSFCTRLDIRGVVTGPVFKWSEMRQFAKVRKWGRTLLTWDENDNNIDPRSGSLHNERWEGVLSDESEYMPPVGGPSCGPFNKRNEIDSDHSGEFNFYCSPVDRRLHLLGAEHGWIKVDYDYDGRVDLVIEMDDTDNDGFFDTWKYDCDADSAFEYSYRLPCDSAVVYPFDYWTLHDAYLPLLKNAARDDSLLIDALKLVLARFRPGAVADPVENYFNRELINYDPDFRLGEKIKNSPEGQRYYADLIRIRYWEKLRGTESVRGKPAFPAITKAYESGRFDRAAEMLKQTFLADGK